MKEKGGSPIPKKKTHEEYLNELKEKDINVEVIGAYINACTPIEHKCLKHNYVWNISPHGILTGRGCPLCGKEKYALARKKTHEQYVREVNEIHPNIEVVDKYINASTSILHRCLIDEYEWYATPNRILGGAGCPKCAGNAKKTHEQYVEELKKNHPNIIVIGTYKNAQTHIKHKCLIDGYEWMAKPNNLLNGHGCPKCYGNIQKNSEEYKKELASKRTDVEVIGEYINAKTPISHRCKIHDYVWSTAPSNVLKGDGCPYCLRDKISSKNSKIHDEYVSELAILNPNIEVLGEYAGALTSILHRCKKDGFEWLARPGNILQGTGCPKCNESRGEREIGIWLNNHEINYYTQYCFDDCRDQQPLPFDFYLPGYNSCIEFDGEQHRKPNKFFGGEEAFKIRTKHDEMKNIYCQNNNIRLLRIREIKDINNELNNFLLA